MMQTLESERACRVPLVPHVSLPVYLTLHKDKFGTDVLRKVLVLVNMQRKYDHGQWVGSLDI